MESGMKRLMTAVVIAAALAAVGMAGATASPLRHVTTGHARLSLRPLWIRSIRPNADSSPAYAGNVALPHGKHLAMIFVLAGNNTSDCNPGDPVRQATLYALNAQSGAVRWTRSTTGASRCTTAAPVVVGKRVYAPGLDGKVHAYETASGQEYRAHGWPLSFSLMPDVEKVSANLTATNRYLYVTTSGFIGDAGHYQGHLVTIDLRTGRSRVFNSLCSNIRHLLGPIPSRSNYCPAERSGLFGRGQGVVDPATHDVYVVSGNGPWNGSTNWGDSILKLEPSGSRLLDSFTPTNQAGLEASDSDLGSTGPALLPPIREAGRVYHLLVQGGKGPACGTCNGVALRLLNRDNLSGQGGPGHLGGDLADVQAPGSCEVLTAPSVWRSPTGTIWVFYANDCGAAGYRLYSPLPGNFRLDRGWFVHRAGTTPVMNRGVLYVAGGQLSAYDPITGTVLTQTPTGGLHWQYPLIAGNRVYLADQGGHVSAFLLSR